MYGRDAGDSELRSREGGGGVIGKRVVVLNKISPPRGAAKKRNGLHWPTILTMH